METRLNKKQKETEERYSEEGIENVDEEISITETTIKESTTEMSTMDRILQMLQRQEENSKKQAERIEKLIDENSKRQDLGFKQMEQRLEQHKEEVQMYLQQIKHEVEQKTKEISQNLEKLTKKLHNLEKHVEGREEEIEDRFKKMDKKLLEVKTQHNTGERRQLIIHNGAENKVQFGGDIKKQHPVPFIRMLKNRKQGYEEFEDAKDMIRNHFKDGAALWFESKQNELQDWEEFERKFLRYYWGKEKQMVVNSELQNGKYDEKLGMSEEKYALQVYASGQYLNYNYSEEQLVELIARHFDNTMEDYVTLQGYRDMDSLCQFLVVREARRKERRTRRQTENNGRNQTNRTHNYRPSGNENTYRYNGYRDNEGQRYTNNFHKNRYEQNRNGYQQNRFQNNGRNYNSQPCQPNTGRENFNRGNQYNNHNGQGREQNREINNLSLIREGEDEQGHQEIDNVEVESNRAGPSFRESTH
uniref:Cilia- and flagella-associated protein 45-like n=1 Tax=Diabrotica virgifera virgifera TaxID=50390 RepID=A0A6P7H495_DIAVI